MDLGVPELLIIAAVVFLLFGSKKLPGAAKSVGQSLKIFKDETKSLRAEDETATRPTLPAVAQPVVSSVQGQRTPADVVSTDAP